jgi:hypothetical protein
VLRCLRHENNGPSAWGNPPVVHRQSWSSVIFPSHIYWHVADPGSRSGFKTWIRQIARLQEYVWHPSPKPLLTLSSQAFPTELKRNPSIYLPTMNSTHIRLKHRKGSVMITRRDTTAAWASAFRRSWHMFLEDCRLQVAPRHLSYRAVGLGRFRDLPLRWPSRFYHLVSIIAGRSCCLGHYVRAVVSYAIILELSFRQFLLSQHGLSLYYLVRAIVLLVILLC